MNLDSLMTMKNFNLPICSECKEWPWCATIPQECERRKRMIKEAYAWFGDQYIIVLVDDVDEDMTTEDIIDAASEVLFSNMSWEVFNGEEG